MKLPAATSSSPIWGLTKHSELFLGESSPRCPLVPSQTTEGYPPSLRDWISLIKWLQNMVPWWKWRTKDFFQRSDQKYETPEMVITDGIGMAWIPKVWPNLLAETIPSRSKRLVTSCCFPIFVFDKSHVSHWNGPSLGPNPQNCWLCMCVCIYTI